MYGWRGVSGSEFAQVCAFPTGARSISGVSVRLEYMDTFGAALAEAHFVLLRDEKERALCHRQPAPIRARGFSRLRATLIHYNHRD
jgi:hypothetical protein